MGEKASAQNGYRPDIDGLRAVAVLGVIAFHAFPGLLPAGYAGVDVFFAISGYLISSHLYSDLAQSGSSLGGMIGRFYARRVRRIFPALIVVLAAAILAGYLLLLPGEFAQLCRHAAGSAGFVANLQFSKETGYFQSDALSNPLLHLWSLGVEEQYYLLWPLAIWVALRTRVGILPVALFLATLSLAWNAMKPESVVNAAYFLPQYRLWELMAGSLLALVPQSTEAPAPKRPVAGLTLETWAGLALAVGVLVLSAQAGSPSEAIAMVCAHPYALGAPFAVALLALVFRQIAAPVVGVAAALATLQTFASPRWEAPTGARIRFRKAVSSGAKAPRRPPRAAWWTSLRQSQAAIGLVLIACSMGFGSPEHDVPNSWTLVCIVGSVLVIGAPPGARLGGLLDNPLAVGIGLISYPLYLWHWPILSFWRTAADAPATGGGKAVAIGAAFVLATVTYYWIERPVRRRPASGPWIGLLAGAMACVAAVGGYCALHHGFRSRLPALLRGIEDTQYLTVQGWREGTYFLRPEQDETAFPNDPTEISPGKPTLVLWGDSHAAALYPGIKRRYESTFNILERTAARVRPILGEVDPSRPDSASINNAIFELIRRERPAVVVLSARWVGNDWTLLEKTFAALKGVGVARIILVGPVPEWQGGLPQQLFNYARLHRGQPVPTRLREGTEDTPVKADAALRALCSKDGIEYFSAMDVFRSGEGTLVRVGDTPESLVSFDSEHLTVAASDYLVARLPSL